MTLKRLRSSELEEELELEELLELEEITLLLDDELEAELDTGWALEVVVALLVVAGDEASQVVRVVHPLKAKMPAREKMRNSRCFFIRTPLIRC